MTGIGAVELRETHSAIVLLAGDRAYKMKKPVDLGFLDFRSESSRRQACERELELNRRLAPDVYLDVLTVSGSDGRPVEHCVLMRRMPDCLRLATMIARGEDVDEHLMTLADLVSAFHATADRSDRIAAEGTAAGLGRRWADNLRETKQFRGGLLAAELYDEISRLSRAYVEGRDILLAERAAAGLVVDGHGDLTAEDVFCLPDHPRALDCIEFDDRLRWLDVLDDVAFLAMDLEHLGRPDLGVAFLRRYLRTSGVASVASLEHHYIAYRAYVRAKVECIQADQGRAGAAAEAQNYARLALRHLSAGEVTLTVVGGAPGSGKSTLARALCQRTGAVLLSTDQVRRDLPPAADRYSEAAKLATYQRLVAQGRQALQHGRSVIADATWTQAQTRDLAARVAVETSSRLIALECQVPVELAAARAQRRQDLGGDASEAGADVARKLAAGRLPWAAATPVQTAGSVEESVRIALAAMMLPSTVTA